MLETDAQFFAARIPQDGTDPSVHVATLRRSPSLTGYAGAIEYLSRTRAIDVKRTTLIGAVQNRELPFWPIGKSYCFAPDDIDQWLDSLRVGAQA